jgi:hypothetical protein
MELPELEFLRWSVAPAGLFLLFGGFLVTDLCDWGKKWRVLGLSEKNPSFRDESREEQIGTWPLLQKAQFDRDILPP